MHHAFPVFARSLLLLVALSLAACGGSKPATAVAGPPAVVEIPVELESGVQIARVTGDDGMHYNGNRITVHAGQPVRVELKNTGRMPRDQMAHNFVLLQPGADVVSFNFASALAKDQGYMPADQMASVIAFTAMAGPGQTMQVEFPAPAPGDYPFLCNFPGHFAGGMKGTLVVLPAVESK